MTALLRDRWAFAWLTKHADWEFEWRLLTHETWVCSICERCSEDCVAGCHNWEAPR